MQVASGCRSRNIAKICRDSIVLRPSMELNVLIVHWYFFSIDGAQEDFDQILDDETRTGGFTYMTM